MKFKKYFIYYMQEEKNGDISAARCFIEVSSKIDSEEKLNKIEKALEKQKDKKKIVVLNYFEV